MNEYERVPVPPPPTVTVREVDAAARHDPAGCVHAEGSEQVLYLRLTRSEVSRHVIGYIRESFGVDPDEVKRKYEETVSRIAREAVKAELDKMFSTVDEFRKVIAQEVSAYCRGSSVVEMRWEVRTVIRELIKEVRPEVEELVRGQLRENAGALLQELVAESFRKDPPGPKVREESPIRRL